MRKGGKEKKVDKQGKEKKMEGVSKALEEG